ncbi:hypothetical protein [Spartinivicinus ruber]|uniref:hypothetical protein n=1 Tax=Spartinivicinus ruber TaxID=2683272 RepID=UPI0013D04C7B|nr:hypothetical protein [Spartinivicinus ruber]
MGTTGILDVTGFSQEKVDALLKVINETKASRYENPSNPEDIENIENFVVVDRQKETVDWHITEDQLTNIWESKFAKSQQDEDGFGGLFGDGE